MNEQEDIKELRELSQTHITQTVFWWAMIATMAVFGYIVSRVSAVENQVNDNRVIQAKIETQLAQIQADITELKVILKEHDN